MSLLHMMRRTLIIPASRWEQLTNWYFSCHHSSPHHQHATSLHMQWHLGSFHSVHTFSKSLGNWSRTRFFEPSRNLWGWLNFIFNKVDENRIKEVGPERACAEWLLRCGASVKWLNYESWTKDYNALPVGGSRLHKIEEIDGTDSAVMYAGFPHFKGCRHIRRIIFHKASYLDDAALAYLPYLKDSLKEVQISSCGNITVEGLQHLKKLEGLEYLLLYDLPEIRDRKAVEDELQKALPNCAIVFPYADAKDDPDLKKKEDS